MNTEENILNTTYELLLEKRNLNISMSEICKKSNTSPGTIYYHFENKEELIKTTLAKYIISVYFNQISYLQNLEGTTFDKIKSCYYFGINFNQHAKIKEEDSQKFLLLLLQSNEKYPELFQKYSKIKSSFNEVLNNIISEGINNGELKDNLNVEKLIKILKKDINGIFFTKYLNDINIQKLTDETFELTWNYIKNK